MTHYIITSVAHLGDVATISGTVDGNPITVTGWWSVITGAANVAAAQTYIFGLMQAQYVPPIPVTTNIYNGSITQ